MYIDGGIRRGTDVLKALCLGAKAVGLGRAFLYAQSVSLFASVILDLCLMYVKAYGEAGVVHVVRILQREIRFAMQSLGVQKISELVPQMVSIVRCAFAYFC